MVKVTMDKFVGFKIEKEIWSQFFKKYGKNSCSKLREFIRRDLESLD